MSQKEQGKQLSNLVDIQCDTIEVEDTLDVADLTAAHIDVDAIVIPWSTIPPSNPVKGQLYFNSAGNSLNVYNGTIWKSIGLS